MLDKFSTAGRGKFILICVKWLPVAKFAQGITSPTLHLPERSSKEINPALTAGFFLSGRDDALHLAAAPSCQRNA